MKQIEKSSQTKGVPNVEHFHILSQFMVQRKGRL